MKTENEILEIAFLLFLEKGFSEVSTNELIRAAGLTKGGFYYSFKSRDDLDQQVVEKYIRPFFSRQRKCSRHGKKAERKRQRRNCCGRGFSCPSALRIIRKKSAKRLPFGISISCFMKG